MVGIGGLYGKGLPLHNGHETVADGFPLPRLGGQGQKFPIFQPAHPQKLPIPVDKVGSAAA